MKITVHLDHDVLRAASVAAERSGMGVSDVVEAALRRYLGIDVIEGVRERSRLGADEAAALAYRELHDSRR